MRIASIALALVACHAPAGRLVPLGAPIGTDGPAALVAADPRGQWVVVCQARADSNHDGHLASSYEPHGDVGGDRLRPYLIRGGGGGEAFDDFVATDASGRWLVLRQGAAIVLVGDARRVTLDAVVHGPESLSGIRRVRFDDAGRRLTYVTPSGRIAVRDLERDTTTEIDPGPGLLWDAWIDRAGTYVVWRSIPADSDGDGLLDGPGRWSTEGLGPLDACQVPNREPELPEELAAREPALAGDADRLGKRIDEVAAHQDRLEVRIARVDGSGRADGVLGVLGGRVLRAGEGAIPARCGELLDADAGAATALLSCHDGAHTTVELHGGHELVLAGRFPDPVWTTPRPADTTIVDVWSRGSRLAVDLASERALRHDGLILHRHGHRAVIWLGPGRGRVLADLASGRVQPIDADPELGAGRFAWGHDRLIDLATGSVTDAAGPIAAVRPDGALLLYRRAARFDDDGSTALGPLRWARVPGYSTSPP